MLDTETFFKVALKTNVFEMLRQLLTEDFCKYF